LPALPNPIAGFFIAPVATGAAFFVAALAAGFFFVVEVLAMPDNHTPREPYASTRIDPSDLIARTPVYGCPACEARRRHEPHEWRSFHPRAGQGIEDGRAFPPEPKPVEVVTKTRSAGADPS
jgi:hypothetical protein